MTDDKLEAARAGNWFLENDLAIVRLDKLSRNEDVQAKLNASDCRYDLIVCDEAHKLSATAAAEWDRDIARRAIDELFVLTEKHRTSESYLELMKFVV